MNSLVYTATQPLLFPAIYMMARFAECHKVVILEEAQYNRRVSHSRTLISNPYDYQWASIPVKNANREPLNEVLLADPKAGLTKFKNQITEAYRKAKYWNEHKDKVLNLIDYYLDITEYTDEIYLMDLSIQSMRLAMDMCGFECLLVMSQRLLPIRPEDASQWMADLGPACWPKSSSLIYLGGASSINSYLKKEHFDKHNTQLRAQEYKMLPYPTSSYPNTRSDVSFLDALFHIGKPGLTSLVCN